MLVPQCRVRSLVVVGVLMGVACVGIALQWSAIDLHNHHQIPESQMREPNELPTNSARIPYGITESNNVLQTLVPSVSCTAGRLIDFPLTGLEQELRRLGSLVDEVMREVGAVYWPTDGTLLGLMRNGRVSTDRDLDYQIHSTYDKCFEYLSSLKAHFERRARIKSFKVVKTKLSGRKIGRYAMVRLYRQFGTFDTGPDFNCVYMDDATTPKYFTHRGVLTPVPAAVYPLGYCLMYGKVVPCPKDGMSVLESLKPRYEGCMVFPHCIGDPSHSSRKCMSPHPEYPLKDFVDSTEALHTCGFTSLSAHFESEPSCKVVLSGAQRHCETIDGTQICFLQKFDG